MANSLLAALLFFSLNTQADVLSFYPTGSVKKVQQVSVRFTTDMTAMGDARVKVDPFQIRCAGAKPDKKVKVPNHTTRWADTRNWVVDFDKALGSGIRCTFTLKEDLKDLAGNKVTGLEEYSLATAGPAILSLAPQYNDIEPDQFFILQTDGPIDEKSLLAKVFFETSLSPDPIGIRVVTGKQREDVIRAATKTQWDWHKYRALLTTKPTRPFAQIKEFNDFSVIAATRRFPEEATVTLRWPRGILSQSGMAVEEEQSFEFNVIKAFKAELSCERSRPDAGCNPLLNIVLRFSREVDRDRLTAIKLTGPGGKSWTPIELKEAKNESSFSAATFKGPFPAAASLSLTIPSSLKDNLGRSLTNQKQFPLKITTDNYSPLIKFSAPFGLLELKAEPLLPVSVRNVEKELNLKRVEYNGRSLNLSTAKDIIAWYRRVLTRDWNLEKRSEPLLEKEGSDFKIPKPLGEKEFELVGIPLKKPGLYVVEVASPKLGHELIGDNKTMYVSTAALVTDMAVHLKLGRESSLVWVTQLSTGKPVADAKISLTDFKGKDLGKATTDKFGIAKLGSFTKPCSDENREEGYETCEVFAFAVKGEDISFVSSDWQKGIESYRFNVNTDFYPGEWTGVNVHTILDRMAAQPGDTVQMKHILREYNSGGFKFLDSKQLPKRIFVVHEGSRKTYALPIKYDKATGSAVSSFELPKEAALGEYSVYFSKKEKEESEDGSELFDWSAKSTAKFTVAEYRLPLMRSHLKVQGSPLIRPKEVKVDLSASYLSGGPAKGLEVKLRSAIEPGSFHPDVPGANDYLYFSTPLKPGVFDPERRYESEEKFLKVQNLSLNNEGGLLATLPDFPAINRVQNLRVEMEYTDPSGEIKTSSSMTPLFPAKYIVGLRTDGWYTEPGKTKVLGIITNINGQAQKNHRYIVEAFQTNYITHRKRLVGGFYSYDSKSEVIALGKVCEGLSDEQGRFSCEPKKLPPGSITLQAKTLDESQHATYAAVEISVYEPGADRWWTPSDSDRIDILPDRTQYEPGEKARFIVRTPFTQATALISVEREGILDAFVTEITRDNPSFEIPVKGEYAPNIYVSALLVRGRVGDPKPTALVDLSRPAMRMGLTDVRIGWKAHELLVDLTANKQKYQTREKAEIKIKVKPALGEKLAPNTYVTVVAVDEALMNLKENTSWKILEGMMGRRALSIQTSSGQNQVIGKRHFGSKAKEPGGGGAAKFADMTMAPGQATREQFNPVLFWEPNVKINAQGEASVVVPLNDSLTSFRIVAVATAGEQLFGDGKVVIQSSKDLLIYSGFAPLVREGDQIKNTFTVRNTTEKAMKVDLSLSSKEVSKLPKLKSLELKANEARVVEVPLKVPENIRQISFEIKAKDSLSGAQDAMISKVKVGEAVPARVTQATLFQLEKDHQIPLKQPEDSLPGKGGIKFSARSSLAPALAGVRNYMRDYPYTCFEQKISKAIVLEDKNETEKLIESLPAFTDSFGLIKYFSVSECGSAQLSRYVLNILDENGYKIPPETLNKTLQGLRQYLHGSHNCSTWWETYSTNKLSGEEKLLIMESLSRFNKFQKADLDLIKITPNLWKTETLTAWVNLLKRSGDIPEREKHLAQAENILRARVNFQGSTMSLQNELGWEGRWQLFTSEDQEALGVFGLAIDDKNWQEDVGRMARGLVARLKLGKWDTTTANAWGVTYFKKFSAKFESEKLSGETLVAIETAKAQINWKTQPQGDERTMPWPDTKSKSSLAQISHNGSGKPWVHVETSAATVLSKPLDLGYKITRKVTPVLQSKAGQWSVGDVINVALTVTAKADQPWVVVRDPVPAGASHLGTGLDASSNLLDRAPKRNSAPNEVQFWPAEYEEKPLAYFISYAGYLPRGTYELNYRLRLNAAGEFKLPPSRVEALYAPESFGETPVPIFKVVAAP